MSGKIEISIEKEQNEEIEIDTESINKYYEFNGKKKKNPENWDKTGTLRKTDMNKKNKKLEKVNTLNSYI